MYCEKCGSKLANNALFCNECGAKVEKKDNDIKPVNKNNKSNNKNGLKTASIVLGILGIVGGITILFSIPGFILSVIGLILGICATKKGKNILGIVLNSVGLFISIVATILSVFVFKYAFDYLKINIDEYIPEINQNETSKNKYDFSNIDLTVLYENAIPIDIVLNKVDDVILKKLYPENEDMNNEVNKTAENYYNMYEGYYGYTKEEFLKAVGFYSEKDFIDYLKLDYRRNKYILKYVEERLTDDEIETYYGENVFGDINSKHILVKVSEEDFSDAEARKIANEIIDKLNHGSSWEEVINKYKDKIISEELGYKAFNADLESAYLDECRILEVGTYSKIPVKTSYGYHIIYKIDQKERPTLEEVKDVLIEELVNSKLQNNKTLFYKALIHLREEAGFSFENTFYESQYEKYIENNS